MTVSHFEASRSRSLVIYMPRLIFLQANGLRFLTLRIAGFVDLTLGQNVIARIGISAVFGNQALVF